VSLAFTVVTYGGRRHDGRTMGMQDIGRILITHSIACARVRVGNPEAAGGRGSGDRPDRGSARPSPSWLFAALEPKLRVRAAVYTTRSSLHGREVET
jgi:hypothetical protein